MAGHHSVFLFSSFILIILFNPIMFVRRYKMFGVTCACGDCFLYRRRHTYLEAGEDVLF